MVDPVRGDFANDDSLSIGTPGVARVHRRGARDEASRAASLPPELDRFAEVRLHLQRGAPANLRRAVRRAATRFFVLVTADLAVFAVMRFLVRAVRDRDVVGNWLGSELKAVLPPVYLNGWEFAASLLLALMVTGTYGHGDRRRDPARLFAACALAAALPLWSTLWTRGVEPVLLQYALTTVLVWAGLVTERFTVDRLIARVRPPGADAADTLFVGCAEDCGRLAASPAFGGTGEYRAVGFVDAHKPVAPGALGHIADFPLLLAASGVQTVVVCGDLPDSQFQEVADVTLAAGCQLLSVPRALDRAGVQPSIVWREGQALMQLTTPSLKGQQLLVKRVLDLIGATLGLVLAAPAMLILAIAIKLDSRGPVFFRQERIGVGGRRFELLKFRTMYDGVPDTAHRELVTRMLQRDDLQIAHAGPDGKPVFKLVNDDRVTRVGRWVRRRSLDELPQLLNVLKGDMSLVGPRPPLPYEFEQYEHWQFHRLQVRPGITGLWQVSGRNRLDYRQMCELDVDYIRTWSLWLDLKILVKTMPVVLSNSGRAA